MNYQEWLDKGKPNNEIVCCNCIEGIKQLSDNSVDAIITDPPYELGFMGKKWDNTGIANNIEMWKECLRVLKPGGHLLSFGGTRTYHRMVCAIENAGFEIRDMINWTYGSGFPKSLNISKELDKKRLGDKFGELRRYLKNIIINSNISQIKIKEYLGYPLNSGVISHWIGKSQPCVPSGKDWIKLKEILPIDNRYDNLILEVEREIVGISNAGFLENNKVFELNNKNYGTYNVTIPATEQAKQWEGWGTALKPSHEPIVLARKPLSENTVAENVLKYGTGGINIDECRVDFKNQDDINESVTKNQHADFNSNGGIRVPTKGIYSGDNRPPINYNPEKGRFPANTIHDNSEEVNKEFDKADIGTPSRFFKSCEYSELDMPPILYYAKASTFERNDGCEELDIPEYRWNNDGEMKQIVGRKGNFHPTVKPVDLIEYLVKLIAPKNGLVLDPFMGSGTLAVAVKKTSAWKFIGFEKEKDYVEIGEQRIKDLKKQIRLIDY